MGAQPLHLHDSELVAEGDSATGLERNDCSFSARPAEQAAGRVSCWTYWEHPVRLPSAISVWIQQLKKSSIFKARISFQFQEFTPRNKET